MPEAILARATTGCPIFRLLPSTDNNMPLVPKPRYRYLIKKKVSGSWGTAGTAFISM